jgi:glucose dehydrogenase
MEASHPGFGALSLALVGCQQAKPRAPRPCCARSPGQVDAQRLADASKGSTQWITYGGNYEETRFSPLKLIDTGNGHAGS